MSVFVPAVFVTVAVGDGPGLLSLADTDRLAGGLAAAGGAGLLVTDPDAGTGGRAIDPSVVAGYLAGRHDRGERSDGGSDGERGDGESDGERSDGGSDLVYIVEASTGHNAPYNLARRIAALDRATGGRVGLLLRAGHGDEVSDATSVAPSGDDPAARWSEYAEIVTRLWESFPRSALLGDQEQARVVDDTLIRPINHVGAYYQVAGPLDGPPSPQGAPVLLAAGADGLDPDRVGAVAEAIIDDSGDPRPLTAIVAGQATTVGTVIVATGVDDTLARVRAATATRHPVTGTLRELLGLTRPQEITL